MATVDPLKVVGLRDFQAALRKMDGESQKKLRLVLNGAAELVASPARGKAGRDSKRAAASIKAASSQREAQVKGGGARVPFYAFMDFGGSVGRGHVVGKANSGQIKRPFYASKGRYIYKAHHEVKGQISKKLVDGLGDLAKEAGLSVEKT